MLTGILQYKKCDIFPSTEFRTKNNPIGNWEFSNVQRFTLETKDSFRQFLTEV